MKHRQRSLTPRDQAPSAFASVLMRLCEAVDALGAALVDNEGETVDYAAKVAPFDMKVVAAEMSMLLNLVRSSRIPRWPDTQEVLMRGSRRSVHAHALEQGYALVLLLPARAFHISRRALGEAIRDLSREAGLELPIPRLRDEESWCRVDVRTAPDRPRRPVAIWLEGAWRDVEVLGRFREGLTRREIGYRARLGSGAELNLVREPFDRWYADVLQFGAHARA